MHVLTPGCKSAHVAIPTSIPPKLFHLPIRSLHSISLNGFLLLFSIKLEGSTNCENFDFLEIKVKKGRYSNERIAVCGSLNPRVLSIKLDGESVEMTFKTDMNVNARGFKISYRGFGKFQRPYFSLTTDPSPVTNFLTISYERFYINTANS